MIQNRWTTRKVVVYLIVNIALIPWTAFVLGDQTVPAARPGIAATKPATGPAVKLSSGEFMVAYRQRIPGTDIEFEMIPIPAGSFVMGTPENAETGNDDERPTVKMNVRPMWVAKTEVTWQMYKEYMRMYGIFKKFETKGQRPVDPANLTDAITAPTELYDPSFTYEYGKEPQQPAVTMTQYAAQQFTKWLSKLTGSQYRLPTEAEWEYACRAGTQTAYSFGDDPAMIDQYAAHFDNSYEGPQPVGTKKPNAFGLHDMHGNAAEWTVNAYDEDGYQWMVDENLTDATEASRWPEMPWPCVARGGSWEMDPEDLRSASRLASDDEEWKSEDPNFPRSPWWHTSDPSRGVGFRLFRSLENLPDETITRYWEAGPEDTLLDVESRVMEGRGGYGIVDPTLPQAIKDLLDG